MFAKDSEDELNFLFGFITQRKRALKIISSGETINLNTF